MRKISVKGRQALAFLFENRYQAALIPAAFLAAVLPLVAALLHGNSLELPLILTAFLNLCAWCLVIAFFVARSSIATLVNRLAEQFGIETRYASFEKLTTTLLADVERKNSALIPRLLERRIPSKQELSHTLECIVAHAFKLLRAESAELALFDKESGLYHSSFVLGKPFRKSAQAMLSGAKDNEAGEEEEVSPDVMIEPLAFGGSVFGSLRVGLKRGNLPTQSDREIMHLVALQAGLAVVNARFTEELMRMRHSSEESIKAKTGFLANLSHEIRAPLGTMLNAVELVLDGLCGPVNGEQLETLTMVKSNGAHLLELLQDVLDYARVESGKMVPNRTEILVDEMLKDICMVVRSQAEAKHHHLQHQTGAGLLSLACDRRHLRQMLINLLTNAIKYTPDNGDIEVWAERIPGNKIKISVKDSGIGIEEADRAKVFAPFERIQNAYSITQAGTGLGMPLTKKLAEVNGGSIDFSSRVSGGSTFWLVLPAVEFDPAGVEKKPVNEKKVNGRGELLLLLETEDGERKMIEKHLSHVGFRVAAASTKVEALDLLRAHRFQLAILDNQTLDNPEEDLLKTIRENARSARLPVVLLSSRAFVFDIEKYLRAGVDRCLTKPVSLNDLAFICRELIDGEDGNPGHKRTIQRINEIADALIPDSK